MLESLRAGFVLTKNIGHETVWAVISQYSRSKALMFWFLFLLVISWVSSWWSFWISQLFFWSLTIWTAHCRDDASSRCRGEHSISKRSNFKSTKRAIKVCIHRKMNLYVTISMMPIVLEKDNVVPSVLIYVALFLVKKIIYSGLLAISA